MKVVKTFRGELSAKNSTGAVSQPVTNRAVQNGTTNLVTGNLFLPRTPEAFTYDVDGDLTSDGRWTNRWDGENRLIDVTSHASGPSGSRKSIQFLYDYQGRRVSKVVSNWTGSAWTRVLHEKYVYDGWNLLAVLNGTNNALLKSFLWGHDLSGSLRAAGGVGGLLAVSDGATGVQFVGYDGNGNVTVLARATDGTASAEYEYGPFGEGIRSTGIASTNNPFRFSTKFTDTESDLLYYGYRYLSASTGRWLSRDPIGEKGGKNLYGMVNNNLVNYRDNLGYMKVCCSDVSGPWYERTFRHCDIANSCNTGEDAYAVRVDKSQFRKLDNGMACECATKWDIEECLRRHPYNAHPRGGSSLPWPLDEIGNNCQTSVILSLGHCCLKSNWRPNWYAGDIRGICIRGHQVAVGPPVYWIFVCDEWELPDWTGDTPPSDVPTGSDPSWPDPRPPRPKTGSSR